jgi:hypothetical protein
VHMQMESLCPYRNPDLLLPLLAYFLRTTTQPFYRLDLALGDHVTKRQVCRRHTVPLPP